MGVSDFQSGANTIIPFVFLWEVILRGLILFKLPGQDKIEYSFSTEPENWLIKMLRVNHSLLTIGSETRNLDILETRCLINPQNSIPHSILSHYPPNKKVTSLFLCNTLFF